MIVLFIVAAMTTTCYGDAWSHETLAKYTCMRGLAVLSCIDPGHMLSIIIYMQAKKI